MFSKYENWKNELVHNDQDLYHQLINLNDKELKESFEGNLSFGTGGMRGLIGVGPNRLNKYTVRSAIYGFSKTLSHKSKIVIGFDTRKFSKDFAEEAARVLLFQGHEVFLFSEFAPTPEVVFSIENVYHADYGIVITASHNPKEYNGIKIYNNHGCQLLPDQVAPIAAEVSKVNDPFSIPIQSLIEGLRRKKLVYVSADIDSLYLDTLIENTGILGADKGRIKIVYTPLHGTGIRLFRKLMEKLRLSSESYVCLKQVSTTGEFHTVSVPNPEEVTAFNYSVSLAQENDADVILATDPDADRLGVMLKSSEGKYKVLNGNQIGILLLDYLIGKETEGLLSRKVVYSTYVSTQLVNRLSEKKNFRLEKFLTGFKYIGNAINKLDDKSKFLFGFEESCGYLVTPLIQDKDAFQAIILLIEMLQEYKGKGMTAWDKLEELYQEFGYYKNELVTKEIDKNMDLYEQLRINNLDKQLIKEKKIYQIEDYRRQEFFCFKENESISKLSIVALEDEFIRIVGENHSVVYVRQSGTEPKLKIYYEAIGRTEEESTRILIELKDFIENILLENM